MEEQSLPLEMPGQQDNYKLPPPMYDGDGDAESFGDWLHHLEDFFDLQSVTADEKKIKFLLYCAGRKAARAYRQKNFVALTEAETAAGVTLYGRAKKFLQDYHVQERSPLLERMRLLELQQGSLMIRDYLAEKRVILAYCDYKEAFQDEALRDAFTVGLRADLKKAVCRAEAAAHSSGNAFSSDDAVTAAIAEEPAGKALEAQLSQAGGSGLSVAEVTRRQKKGGAKKSPHRKRTQSGSSSSSGKSGRSAENTGRRGKTLICYNCGGKGHFARDCPSASQRTSAVARGRILNCRPFVSYGVSGVSMRAHSERQRFHSGSSGSSVKSSGSQTESCLAEKPMVRKEDISAKESAVQRMQPSGGNGFSAPVAFAKAVGKVVTTFSPGGRFWREEDCGDSSVLPR